MSGHETKELYELITQLRLDIATMSGKLDRLNDMDKEVKALNLQVAEAIQSTRSAHKRLDQMDEKQTWTWRTTIGAAVVGVINIFVGVTVYFLTRG